MSENVKKHSQLVKEAKRKLSEVKCEYVGELKENMIPFFNNFKDTIYGIPDKYTTNNLKN